MSAAYDVIPMPRPEHVRTAIALAVARRDLARARAVADRAEDCLHAAIDAAEIARLDLHRASSAVEQAARACVAARGAR